MADPIPDPQSGATGCIGIHSGVPWSSVHRQPSGGICGRLEPSGYEAADSSCARAQTMPALYLYQFFDGGGALPLLEALDSWTRGSCPLAQGPLPPRSSHLPRSVVPPPPPPPPQCRPIPHRVAH